MANNIARAEKGIVQQSSAAQPCFGDAQDRVGAYRSNAKSQGTLGRKSVCVEARSQLQDLLIRRCHLDCMCVHLAIG